MAKDRITVELMLATKQAEREIARINRKVGDIGKTMGKAFGGTGGGGDKVRALGTGLSKATVKADEFNKSMEASNARVIAFGASAGLIMGIDRALKAMVSSAIKVEKALLDVNVVLNATHRDLEKFGKGMFKVAKDTAQGFDTVAEAATELARQGLGMEKTLGRTKDALILTRLTGMGAADAVKTLTAAVNSFNKEGVTSAQIINRMAKVDAAFAVSSEDLAKSISRVGASAVSAGVNMNELMAITTAVQQKTARGGAVIGNAFKTIFTRLQRKDVLQNLRNLGVAVNDLGTGKALSGIQVLQNLAKEFDGLGKATQASTAEQVAGVFQVNILKAALSDLSSVNSQYASSLKVANSATNEAYERNEQLNQSLDALVNRTLANLTAAGAGLGGTLEPAIKNILGTVNNVIEAFGKGGSFEEFGKTMGSGLMKGLGAFIGGPGLIVMTAVFGKIALSLGRFAGQALQDVLGLNQATKQRAALEGAVVAHIASEPKLLAQVRAGTLNVLAVEKEILATVRLASAERSRIQAYASPLTGALMGRGMRAGPRGATLPGGAAGFVPNFANAGSERVAAAAGGYRAGAIKTMNQPGAGTMMYNSAETVKRFPGMSQSAIMPPQGSPAGAGYKSAFGAAHGFDPYAASGFVPNFAPRAFGLRHTGYDNRPAMYTQKNKPLTPDQKAGALTRGGHLTVPGGNIAMLVPQGQRTGMMTGRGEGKYNKFTAQFPVLSYSEGFLKQKYPREPERVDDLMKAAAADVTRQFAASIKPPARRPGKREVIAALDRTAGARGAFQSAAGASFEVGMGLALDKKAAAQEQRFGDFDLRPPYSRKGREIFGGNFSIGDFKIASGTSSKNSMAGKIAKELITNGPGRRFIVHGATPGKATGFVPNFSPITNAIGREMAAGVPASAIRVGSSPSLKGAGNPGGVGVYNTIHEPAGLQQGISRARSQGVNPKGHGIPNYASPILDHRGKPFASPKSVILADSVDDLAGGSKSAASEMKGAAKEARGMKMAMAGMAAQMLAGAAASNMAPGLGQDMVTGAGSVAGYAGLGFAFGGPVGGGVGAAIGGLGMGVTYLKKHTDEAQLSFDNLSAELQKITENSNQVSQSLGLVGEKIAQLGGERDQGKRVQLVQEMVSEMSNLITNVSDPAVRKQLQTEFGTMDKSRLNQAKLSELRDRILAELGTGKQLKEAQLMGTNVRAGDSSWTQFMSNRLGKGQYGQAAAGGAGLTLGNANPLAWFSRTVGSIGSSLGMGGDNYSWGGASRAQGAQMRQLSVRKSVPQFATDLMKMKGTGGREIGELIMGDKGTRKSLESLQSDFEDDGGWKSETAWKAFEKGGVMMEALKGAGVVGDIRKKIRESLDSTEARNILLRTLFGMEMSAIKTEYGDWVSDMPAVEADTTAKLSRKQRGILNQDIGAAEAAPLPDRAPSGLGEYYALIKNLREASASVKEFGLATARQVVHEKKLRSIQSRYDIALAGKGMGDSRTVAQKTMEVALNEAEQGLIDGTKAAVNTFTSKLADGFEGMSVEFKKWAAGQNFFKGGFYEEGDTTLMGKDISGSLPGGDFKSKSQMAMSLFRAMTTGNIDREALRDELKAAQEKVEKGDQTALGVRELTVLQVAPKVLKVLDAAVKEYNTNISKETDLREKAIEAAKKGNRVTLKTIELAGRYARGMELQNQRLGLSRATERLDFIDDDLASGRITGKQYAGFKGSQRKASRDYLGLTEENMKSSIFKDTFTYNAREALEDFEAGQASVAENMKSSFANAFQSISSGANSVQGALANMAQSILNSISQVSSNMFTNMMFSKMGWTGSQGGLVPGYAGGGVVTGGSGYKDDVPTMMQGGEFVIKKSSAQKIGYGNLNAINGIGKGYAEGGPSMGQLGLVAAGASAASGLIGAAMQPGAPKPLPSRDYGLGRGKYGHFGGADPDAGHVDTVTGGGGRAGVSLGKAFVYYRRDPETGRLISERARPTEGRFEVSRGLSLMGRLGEDDPQTGRMFGKEQTMAKYQDYLATETQSRKDQIAAVKRQKRQRLIGAYVNAAMMIGGAKLMSGGTPGPPDVTGPGGQTYSAFEGSGGTAYRLSDAETFTQFSRPLSQPGVVGTMQNLQTFNPLTGGMAPRLDIGGDPRGGANGGMARVMGGEYIMSPDTVRTYGTNFMHELNRGNVPGYANGGPVGGTSAGNQGPNSETLIGGNTTNNVRISVNIDKAGKADASADTGSEGGGEREDNEQANQSKEFSKILQGVVLDEIVKQQRPGGLLQGSPHTP